MVNIIANRPIARGLGVLVAWKNRSFDSRLVAILYWPTAASSIVFFPFFGVIFN
jgi:hypothetical protein